MKIMKKLCAMAVIVTSVVATTVLTASAATVYLDYELNAEKTVATIKLMAKDLPAKYEIDGGGADYGIMAAGAVVDINKGAEDGAFTLPVPPNANAAKNAGWLSKNFETSGFAPIVNYWTGISDTSDASRQYMVFQKATSATDDANWLSIGSDGTAEIARFNVKLVNAGKAKTTIRIERANLSVFNRPDNENYSCSLGDSQLGYTSLGEQANLSLEPLVLNIGEDPVEPKPDYVYNETDPSATKWKAADTDVAPSVYEGTDGSKAVGAKATVNPGSDKNTYTGLVWKVKSADGAKTYTYTQGVNITGAADFVYGIVINGATESDVDLNSFGVAVK